MGFFDELRKLTKPYADDEEEYEDEYEEGDDEEAYEEEEPARAPRRSGGAAPAAPAYSAPTGMDTRRGSKVVNMSAASQLQVVVFKPERFESVSEIADHLRDKHAVLLNLENTEKNVARRVVDFLSGCIYAVDGKIKKVATCTYLLVPSHIEILGDLVEELENSGMYL